MVACDYCDASFSEEDEYLAHLDDAHEGELGAIDRRRVDDLERESGGLPTGPVVLGFVLVVAAGLVAYLTVFSGSGSGLNTQLPNSGDRTVVSQASTEPAESARHVEPGTDVNYSRMPPTGGPHYPAASATSAGFYAQQQDPEAVVHSLEHGAIVVWYDPAQLTPEAEESMRAMASAYQRPFGSFIAVPTPVEEPEHPYVVTAWERRLTMEEYSHETVRQFAGEYLGRGPEGAYR